MPESQGPTPSPLAASPRGGSPVASSQGLDRAPLDGRLVPQLSRARFWALQLQGEGQCLSQPLPASPMVKAPSPACEPGKQLFDLGWVPSSKSPTPPAPRPVTSPPWPLPLAAPSPPWGQCPRRVMRM